MITIVIPYQYLLLGAFLLFAAGKLMQTSGIAYAQGEDWKPYTLMATVLEFALIFFLAAHVQY